MSLSGDGLLPSRKSFGGAFACVMPGPTPKDQRKGSLAVGPLTKFLLKTQQGAVPDIVPGEI